MGADSFGRTPVLTTQRILKSCCVRGRPGQLRTASAQPDVFMHPDESRPLLCGRVVLSASAFVHKECLDVHAIILPSDCVRDAGRPALQRQQIWGDDGRVRARYSWGCVRGCGVQARAQAEKRPCFESDLADGRRMAGKQAERPQSGLLLAGDQAFKGRHTKMECCPEGQHSGDSGPSFSV